MTSFLVVDDSATIRTTLAATISNVESDSMVGQAASEKEALAYLAEVAVDVVFLDMMLTDDGGGLEAAAAIIERWPETKVVLLTGLAEDDPMVRKAISMGAFAYLQKPIRRQQVQEVFDALDFEADRLRRIR